MITQERLKELLHYDPETGVFTWLLRTSNRVKVGSVAGANAAYGYLEIGVDGNTVKSHRLAFLYMTGSMPPNDVDHINGVRDDNRWCNLRLATRSENLQNLREAKSNSSTGLLGVSAHRGRFRATIKSNGKQVALGYFDCPQEAHAAYRRAKAELHNFSTL